MFLFLKFAIGIPVYLLIASTASAYTKEDAQRCINTLLNGYSTQQAPMHLIDMDRMFRNVMGRTLDNLTPDQAVVAREIYEQVIKNAFLSKNGFERISVREVATVKRGYKVTVLADIRQASSGKTYEQESIDAYVSGGRFCGVWKVVIGSIQFSTAHYIREQILQDTRSASFRHQLR